MGAKKYSLWLMPEGEIYDLLKGAIDALGSRYRAPVFEPHITLLGGIGGSEEAASKVRELSGMLRPFVAGCESIDFLDEYYRCLFLRVAETGELLGANREAKRLFHRKRDEGFMPHLSLLYADLPRHLKEEIASELDGSLETSFIVDRLHLVSTSGTVEEWRRVQSAPLEGQVQGEVWKYQEKKGR